MQLLVCCTFESHMLRRIGSFKAGLDTTSDRVSLWHVSCSVERITQMAVATLFSRYMFTFTTLLSTHIVVTPFHLQQHPTFPRTPIQPLFFRFFSSHPWLKLFFRRIESWSFLWRVYAIQCSPWELGLTTAQFFFLVRELLKKMRT